MTPVSTSSLSPEIQTASSLPVLTREQSIALWRQLQDAKTIRDILTLPYPYTAQALPLAPNHEFLSCPERVTALLTTDGQLIEGKKHQEKITELFGQAAKLTAEHNNSYGTKWTAQMEGILTGISRTGKALHFDFPEAMPQDQVHLAASSHGTLLVPHADALTIIGYSKEASFLDIKLDDPSLKQKLKTLYYELVHNQFSDLAPALREASVEMPANTLTVLTGITPHHRPDFASNERICYKAINHHFTAG